MFADQTTIPLPAVYVQTEDPAVTWTDGRVQPLRLWRDISTGTLGTLKQRNAANDAWDTLIDLDVAAASLTTEQVQDIIGAMLVGGEYDDGTGTLRVGYLEIPQNSQSANYTAVLSDQAKHLFHPASDNNPRTFTIPPNASVAYRVGTAITFVNKINTLTIAITSDTLTWAEDGSTGSRTLAANGMATALKITSTEWLISGTGIS